MNVIALDTVYYSGAPNSVVSHAIDIDGIAPADLHLTIHSSLSLMMGIYRTAILSVASNSDIRINGFFTNDTIRLAADTTVVYDPNNTPPYAMTVHFERGCSVAAGEVQSVEPNVFKPHLYQAGAMIDTMAYTLVQQCFYDPLPIHYNYQSQVNDSTILYTYQHILNDCFSLPSDGPVYIAFEKQVNGVWKRGWFGLYLSGGWHFTTAAIEP